MRLTSAIRLVFVATLAVAVVIILSRGPNSILTGNVPPSQPAAVDWQDPVTDGVEQRETDPSPIRIVELQQRVLDSIQNPESRNQVLIEAHGIIRDYFYDSKLIEKSG